jgi:hypothetical protein
MLAVYGVLLIIIAAATAAAVIHWLSSPDQDRIAVIGNFLSFGTLLLALVAGIVALAAYSAATGLPNLRIKISLPLAGHYANFVVLLADQVGVRPPGNFGPNEWRWTKITALEELNTATIVVENTTRYAARTPAVVIQFRGCRLLLDAPASAGWIPTQRTSTAGGGVVAVQWDGGPNYAIHGNSTRHLPDLKLQRLELVDPEDSSAPAELIVRLLADGYDRKAIRFAIDFTLDRDTPPILSEPTREWI